MSVYRRHATGYSDKKEIVDTFHLKRLELLDYFDEYLHGRYHAEIAHARALHRREVLGQLIEKADYQAASVQAIKLLRYSLPRYIRDIRQLLIFILRGSCPRLWQAALNLKSRLWRGATHSQH